MQIKTINIQETKTDLAELLALVSTGTEIILTEGDTPRARLVPVAPRSTPRVAGLHEGAIQTSDDFDEPMPEEFWTGAK